MSETILSLEELGVPRRLYGELCRILDEKETLQRTRERAEVQASGRHGPAEVLPCRDGKDDFGHFSAFLPKRFWWDLYQNPKFGFEYLNSDELEKDLKRHHPEMVPRLVSGRAVSGWTPASAAPRRRQGGARFMPGTMQFA